MAYLIRFITRTPAGGTEQSDKTVAASTITIGRSTDQVLQLRDRRARLQHAEIEQKDGKMQLTTSALAGITVNGKSQRTVALSVGDVIEVGANIIRVIPAPAGMDFAISFELREDADHEQLVSRWSAAKRDAGGISKRKLAWLLVAVVAVAGFAIPFVLFNGFLLAGPVHSVHSSIAADCGSCHTSPFQRVPDAACIECHTVQRHSSNDSHAVLGETRCASCHLEHNDPPQLVNQHQALCADCHESLPGDAKLQDAADFLNAHPAFNVTVIQPELSEDGTTEWRARSIALLDAQNADRSNLTFDHKIHLHTDGIITPDGKRQIDCAECHTPEPGGARMQAVSMDENCSSCHTLAFDPDDPSRVVPHGDAEAVVQALIEYYSARFLGSDPDAVEQRIRRPGQSLSRADRDRAAAEAKVEALDVAEDLFERRACINCHTVTRIDGDFPWKVEPVRLTQTFFPHAEFSHASHSTDVSSCDSCHNASESESSSDLLIPGIAVCRDCHGSAESRHNSSAQIPSTCVMCHGFHFDSNDSYP